jgi:hypothetical protein
MRRAAQDLYRVPDQEFFREIAVGVEQLRVSIADQLDGIEAIPDANTPARAALRMLAQEEAGKVLVLLDAVRCPRAWLAGHLLKFYDHMAKGLYADVVGLHFGTFGDLSEYVERERADSYLDGPGEGPEWVFRNSILWQRERTLYVDRVRWDDDHTSWSGPRTMLEFDMQANAPRAVTWLLDVWAAVPLHADALRVVAVRWRPFQVTNHTRREDFAAMGRQTADDLVAQGLAQDRDRARHVLEEWHFPMYRLNLKERQAAVHT